MNNIFTLVLLSNAHFRLLENGTTTFRAFDHKDDDEVTAWLQRKMTKCVVPSFEKSCRTGNFDKTSPTILDSILKNLSNPSESKHLNAKHDRKLEKYFYIYHLFRLKRNNSGLFLAIGHSTRFSDFGGVG